MKTVLLIAIFLSAVTFVYSQKTSSILGKINSSEVTSISGAAACSFTIYAYDTCQILPDYKINLPPNWYSQKSSQSLPILMLPGDSFCFQAIIHYPLESTLPIYPQNISVECSYISNSNEDTSKIEFSGKVFFTSYNSIEIWSISDFVNLPRIWASDLIPNSPRIFVSESSIPQSNVQVINWQNINTPAENDNADNFREVNIPGLPYYIPMTPVPLDSISYFIHLGDGADSLYLDAEKNLFGKIFSGTISGVFKTNTGIPLRGIKVLLQERDVYFNISVYQTFASGYTDENGQFTLSYSENQFSEGDNIELSLKFISESENAYSVRCTKSLLGDRYAIRPVSWSAPEQNNNQNIGQITISPYNENEAFTAVHYVRNGCKYFIDESFTNIKTIVLKVLANATNSYSFPPEYNILQDEFTLHFFEGHGRNENIVYHEFGHFVMWRLEGNQMNIAFGEDCFTHTWQSENTSHIVWSEAWANFVEFILDAVYRADDGEFGVESNIPISEQKNVNYYSSGNIASGIRSEYYISTALYDLWDGVQKNLPIVIHIGGHDFPGYNDIGGYFVGSINPNWETIDDIEFSIAELCQPLIDEQTSIQTVQDYYFALLEDFDNDCQKQSDISRAFRENWIVWDIGEYLVENNRNNISSDFIFCNQSYNEVANCLINMGWIDTYHISNLNNSNSNNYKYWGSTLDDTHITDQHFIGNVATNSNTKIEFNPTYLYNNIEIVPNTLDSYWLCGDGQLVVRNGSIDFGGYYTSADLYVGANCLVQINSGQNLTLFNNSKIIVESGGTLFIQANSIISLNNNSQIIVNDGGYICIEEGAFINYPDKIILNQGYNIGTNPILNLQHIEPCGTYLCNEFVLFDFPNDLVIVYDSHIQFRNNSFNENIIVANNSTLELDQCVFSFNKNSKIIVEPGAKLVIDGSTLTSLCDQLWQGIELQGNSSLSQLTPGAQGQVILKNGAVIENAIDGITTIGNVEDMSSWDWSKTGGIIKAVNSTFRNCRRGIQFLTYNNVHPTLGSSLPNLSTIRNCTFETTKDLPDGIRPYAFISMNEVNGVKLYGNTFQNTNPSANLLSLGMGIYSINASYTVDQICLSPTIPCSNAQKSRFINLHYGIRSSSTPGLKAVTVKNTVFDLCHFGVYFSGMEYPTVINNDFIVDDYTFHMMTNEYGYGLYLNQCNGFQVEGNDFMSPTSGNRGWTGIYVNNSNTGNGANSSNEIYRNTFTDLYSGIVALNDNDGLYLSDGLKFNCETFNGNTYDISVLPKSNPNIGISAVQGLYFANSFNAKTLSRNWYSATCTGDENQFKIDWYSSEDPTEDPTKAPIEYPIMHANYSGAHWQPECYDPMLQTYSPPLIDNITYSSSDCPDRTILNPIAIRTELQVVSTKKEELNNLIDGGQTNLLVSIAQSNIPEGQMLQTMLEFSPYLSDEVLLTLIERPNALSPGTMQQILAANSPLSDDVYQAVQAMQTPLPKGIRNQIAALQTSEMSDRDQLPYGIAYYEYTEKVLESDLVRYYLNDTLTVNPMDSVMNILEQATTKNSKLNLVSAYISSRHFAKANQTLDSLVNIDADLVSYSEKQRMNILTADLPGKELSLLSDSSKMQVLHSIANDTLQYGAVYAKNTLELLNDTLFAELTLIPMPETDNRSMIAYSSGNQPEIEKGLITCYPNPASEKFTVHYEVESACTEMFLVIHNVMGKEVSRIRVNECIGDVELSSPSETGTYYVYIESCGQYIAIDKIVVTR